VETPDTDVSEFHEELSPEDVEARLADHLKPVVEAPDVSSEKEAEVLDALEVPEAMAMEDIGARLGTTPEPSTDIPIVLPTKKEAAIDAPVEVQEEPSPPEEIETEKPIEQAEEPAVALPETFYRVRLEGESVYFPLKSCMHCMKTPASRKTNVVGSLPTGGTLGRRRAVFSVPICSECRQVYLAKSEAQKNARLQAHLTALIVGLALVVAAVGLDVIDMSRNAAVGLLLVGIIAGVGYLLPVGFLLERAGRIPPMRETHLVRTTLSVRAPEEQVAESYFDFRNKEYAQLFRESNPKAAVSEVEEVTIQPESTREKD
jgi:hypothetical protein